MSSSFTLKQKLALCWRIIRQRPDNLLEHADRELPPDATDEMQALMNQQVRELLLVFGSHGHSGFSASYATTVLEKLLRYEPIRPLTGEESEWHQLDYNDDMRAQNRRCGEVFRRADGTAYHSGKRVFREPDGCCYTNSESSVDITFPYTPTKEYINVPDPLPEEPVTL